MKIIQLMQHGRACLFLGWRKISCYFNISYEIRDRNIEFDENRNVQRAEFVIRAHMQYVSRLVVSIEFIYLPNYVCSHQFLLFLLIFITSGAAGSQMDGALVIDVKKDSRSQIMMFLAQQRLEQRIKLVK